MSTEPTLPVKWAPVWRVQCGVLFVLGIFAWWQLPGGFPWSHARFWMNGALTLLISGLAGGALHSLWKGKRDRFQACVATLAAGAIGMALANPLIFLVTMTTPKALAANLAIAAFEGLTAWRTLSAGRAKKIVWLPAASVGVLVGAFVPWSQRGPEPTTIPWRTQEQLEETDVDGWNWSPDEVPAFTQLDDGVGVAVRSGSLKVQTGGAGGKGLTIDVDPLLTFGSRSPDRCWSILAPREFRNEPARELFAAKQAKNELGFAYRGEFPQRLQVQRDEANGFLTVEATTELEAPVYSHLNSYCAITISGHKRLTLRFSPCSKTEIEPVPFDYPRGRPMRLAYCDGNRFRVVEASSGEKGPFGTLAEGPFKRQGLTIAVCDEGKPVYDVRLISWASQASVWPSPTAGWGLPQNAIEFVREGDDPSSPVQIWITLAGTSVGRGWDTVGHGPGIYSNRLQISPCP